MEKSKRTPSFKTFILIIPVLCAFIAGTARADEVQLKPDHPDRYTVKKGDTLWDIANRFLKSPWLWPRVWKINDQIRNPHLIYPGDVILLRWVNGEPQLTLLRNEKVPVTPVIETPKTEGGDEKPVAQPTLPPPAVGGSGRTDKLFPKIYSEPLGGAIPTIPPNAITPFLAYPLAIDEDVLEKAGYVTTGLDDRIALGDQSEFYARGLKGADEHYQIFRLGKPLIDPESDELLAYEAMHLGDAKLLESGDPTKLIVTSVKQEIQPTDRLLAGPPRGVLPYYYPSAPKTKVYGRIITAINAVAEIGTYGVVGISLGKREGMEEGHVLRVMRHVGVDRDPVTKDKYKLPDEESALIMVFRVYEKVSYAIVLRSTRPVHILDAVVTP